MSVMSVVEAAELLCETRQRLGLTQAQLAEELGFPAKASTDGRTGEICLYRSP